jgi:hypothetical protein
MTGSRISLSVLLAALACAALLQGCATGDKRVDILYHPVAEAKGGAGDLYLVQGVRPEGGQAPGIQWILGTVAKDDGEKLGNIVTDVAPANLVMDALNQELTRAGYRVLTTASLPSGADKALSLNSVSIKLNDKHSVVKDEAECSVRMTVQPWRNGSAVSNLSYDARYSETVASDRDELPSKTLQKALQLLMKQSTPEIVRTLEQK